MSNAPLATNGLAFPLKNLSVKKKVLLWLVMKPDKPVVAILATDYINNVLAILATNTPAPAPDMPAVPALLAAESISPAPAPAAMSGKTELVFLSDQYAKLVLSIIVTTPAQPAWKAAKPCWGLSYTLMALPVVAGL